MAQALSLPKFFQTQMQNRPIYRVIALFDAPTCCRHFAAISARRVPTGRKDVAMGVSPWTQKATATKSPEGAKGKRHTERPVVPLGLAFPRSPYHGLTPVATCCRHFVAISARRVPTGRKDVAMGVSPCLYLFRDARNLRRSGRHKTASQMSCKLPHRHEILRSVWVPRHANRPKDDTKTLSAQHNGLKPCGIRPRGGERETNTGRSSFCCMDPPHFVCEHPPKGVD